MYVCVCKYIYIQVYMYLYTEKYICTHLIKILRVYLMRKCLGCPVIK